MVISGNIRQYLATLGNMEEKLFIKQSAILDVIKEHGLIQMKTLQRSFVTTPIRTLGYHVKKLIEKDLIKKRGITNGVYYEAF